MSIIRTEAYYKSTTGEDLIRALIWRNDELPPMGVVQISHGLTDHIDRYDRFARFLCENGYVVCGNDHLGHGKEAAKNGKLGNFGAPDTDIRMVDDMNVLANIMKKKYPDIPYFLLGHSMGSFLARLYAERYADSIDGLILQGTAGPNPLLPVGRALVALMKPIFGDRHRSPLVKAMAEGSYNNRFKGERVDGAPNVGAWLTRDAETVKGRPYDDRTNFIFTLSGYADLFKMLTLCNSKAHYAALPKDMRIFIMSGADDPVGNFGKGVKTVYDAMVSAGAKCVRMKLYDGARHELFNELCYDEVVEDTSSFLLGVAKTDITE
jgi:alpha-beta hydrolase superfamily lysophospholipase